MSSDKVQGGNEPRPKPPDNAGNTEVEDIYILDVPASGDVANVPGDVKLLATQIAQQLDLRLTESSAASRFQSKIVVATAGAIPAANTLADGAVVFVIA